MPSEKWAVFISGRGSNLAALLDLRAEIDIALVVSSSPKAYGLTRARRAGIAALILPKPIDWSALDRELRARGISRIFLAGFMRLIPQAFVESWQGRMLNLHPSLLPAYPGLASIEKAYADKSDMGCTVHEVVTEVDSGPIIVQRRSLKAGEVSAYSLDQAELKVHIDEQRIVREAVRKWKR